MSINSNPRQFIRKQNLDIRKTAVAITKNPDALDYDQQTNASMILFSWKNMTQRINRVLTY